VFPSSVRTIQKDGELQILWDEPLAPREIAKVVFNDIAPPSKTRRLTTHPCDLVVVDVLLEKPLIGGIRLDPKALAGAAKATLRVVTRDVQTGEATLKIGSRDITLPPSNAEGGHHVIQDIPLEFSPNQWKDDLKSGILPVRVSAAQGSDGFALYSATLLLEFPDVSGRHGE
jgi:hypothetical protein